MKRLLLAVFLFALFITPAFAQDSDEAEMKRLFRDGIEQYKNGNLEKAYELIEASLRKNPAPDLLRYLTEEIGPAIMLKGLAEEGDLKNTFVRILELSKGEARRLEESPEKVQQYVYQLDTPNMLTVQQVVNRLILTGEPAVPFLIAEIGNEKNETLRTNCIIALSKIGADSTLPLVEALKSSNMMIRKNALIILATIKDPRSVPALKKLFEDPLEPEIISQMAAETLIQVTMKSPNDLPPAKELYLDLARRYYRSHQSLMKFFYIRNVFWKWSQSEDKLTSVEMPSFSLNEKLAEDACFMALKIDPQYEDVWPLLLNVYYSEFNEMKLAVENAKVKMATEDLSEEEKEQLEKLNGLYEQLKLSIISILTSNKKYIYEALDMALNDDEPVIAVSIIEALRDYAEPEDLPMPVNGYKDIFGKPSALTEPDAGFDKIKKMGTPLINALQDLDKRTRYAAAQTLVYMQPREKFMYSDEVINVLSQAIEEIGMRAVLVGTEVIDSRNVIKKELRAINCYPVEAGSTAEVIIKAKQFPVCDAIILSFELAQQVVFVGSEKTIDGQEKIELSLVDSLKQDIRTKNIPMFIVCKPEDTMVAETIYGSMINAYIPLPVDRKNLQHELNKAFTGNEEDSKTRANLLAKKSAEAIASIDPERTIYPYTFTYGSLIKVLADRPDDVRIPAARALGNFGMLQSTEALTKILNDAANSPELRLACCNALRDIFRKNRTAAESETYRALKDAYLTGPEELQKSAASALHFSSLTAHQRLELMESKRTIKVD
ncbi:MAG: HEAT repeat domain-containing protein [Planctomycetes bacterium]|nr:HEAT repeat domain-containing protein [Planctomycetota bacterium]